MTSCASSPEASDIAAWRKDWRDSHVLMTSYGSPDAYVDQMLWREWFAGVRCSVYAQFHWYALIRKGHPVPDVLRRLGGYD